MASLKNAFKTQKTHRERHQPEARKELGLLEKRKDYKERAKDFNKKKKILNRLRKKALNKNPDEFNHHMINSKLEDGVHHETAKEEELTPDQVKLMQTRDLTYIVHKRTIEKKKIEKLKANLHLLDVDREDDEEGASRHTFFVESEKEKREFDLAKRLDTHPGLLDRVYNRPRLSQLEKGQVTTEVNPELLKKREKAYKELRQRIERERKLGVIQAKMEVKKHLQNKKEKPTQIVRKESKDAAPILKWPMERKR